MAQHQVASRRHRITATTAARERPTPLQVEGYVAYSLDSCLTGFRDVHWWFALVYGMIVIAIVCFAGGLLSRRCPVVVDRGTVVRWRHPTPLQGLVWT
jgi:hypothetical protein